MKDIMQLVFTKTKFTKLAPECRLSATPLLCQRRWVTAYIAAHQGQTPFMGHNITEMGDEEQYYPDDYYFPYDEYTLEPTPEEEFIKYLTLIVFPYFLLFGTIGNILSIVLMKKYSHAVWSTCVYMTVVLLLDLVTLYVQCGNDWYKKLHDDMESLSVDILLLSNAVCKVYSFMYNLIIHETAWVMVAIGIEMAIAMKYQTLIYKMCTRERGTAIILFISVLLISLNLHFFWTLGLAVPGEDPSVKHLYCIYINELSDSFRDDIWPIIDLLIGTICPLVSQFLCLCIAVPSLRRKHKNNSKTLAEQDALLGKYFLDITSLHELKFAFFIIIAIEFLVRICKGAETALRYLANKGLIEMEHDTLELTVVLLWTVSYIFMSHKFWIFYFCCKKFRTNTCDCLRWGMRLIIRKYRVKQSQKQRLDIDKEAMVSLSWKEEPPENAIEENAGPEGHTCQTYESC